MCSEKSSKRIVIADPRGPEKAVLSSILTRLGYTVDAFDALEDVKEALARNPHLLILHAGLEGASELAYSQASSACRVLLLESAPEQAPELAGFIDVSEHILRGIAVKVPEIVLVVNDFIAPSTQTGGRGIKPQPSVAGGYSEDGETTTGHIFNISTTGAFVELSAPPERGTPLTLHFQLPGFEHPFSLPSQVTWRVLPDESAAMRSPPGCGLFFKDINLDDAARLEDFVIHKGRA